MPSALSIIVKEPIAPFAAYLNSSELSDIQVTLDGETFYCHKIVLANSIPYFKGVFNFYGTKSVVELKDDLRVSGFKEVLNWAYTGQYTISADNVANVIEASRFLHVDSIRDKCLESVQNLEMKEKLIDTFFVAAKQDLHDAAIDMRHRILNNLEEIVNQNRFSNMTLGDLKLLLYYKQGLSGEGSKNYIHPKIILKAILEWTCSDEKRLTEVADLLSFLNLLEIPHDEITQVCEKFDHIIISNPVTFIPLFSRLLKKLDESQISFPALANKKKQLYVASLAPDSVKVNSHSFDDSFQIHPGSGEEMNANHSFNAPHVCNVFDFHAFGGNAYFLVKKRKDFFGVTRGYQLHQLRKSETNCDDKWECAEIQLPLEYLSILERINILKNRAEELAILIRNIDKCYISEWSENKWITKEVEEDEKKHFLIEYCDNHSGHPVSLCSVPIAQIPEPPNFDRSSVTSVCASNDRIYVFAKHLDNPVGLVFDTKTRLWSDLPAIQTIKRGRMVLSSVEINGTVIIILSLKEMFKREAGANNWTKLKKYQFHCLCQHYVAFGY